MQNRMKADRRITTLVPRAPSTATRFPAIAKADVNRDRDGGEARDRAAGERRELHQIVRTRWPLTAQRDRDRNRPWSDRHRHGQWIKRIDRHAWRTFGGAATVFRILVGVEQPPAKGRHDQSASDAHDRQRDAEKLEHMGANEKRTEQQHEAVDPDTPSQRVTLRSGIGLGQAQKNRRASDRIDDGKQSRINEQKSVDCGRNAAHVAFETFRLTPYPAHTACAACAPRARYSWCRSAPRI